jgi:hypothetical protein
MTTKRKSIQTITDPLLEPFFITKDEYSFTVKQNVTSDASHFRAKKGTPKTYEKSLFFYADFARAIEKIAQLKAETDNFDSLEEYIKNYKSISINIKNYTDGIRSAI